LSKLICISIFLIIGSFALNSRTITLIAGDDFQSIIKSSKQGDTVILDKMELNVDGIFIDKSITIIGRNGATINGRKKNHILIIRASNVTIKDLKIENSGVSYVQDRAGIKADSADNLVIENCKILNCMFALHLSGSKNIIVRNNHIKSNSKREANSGNGVHLWYCKDVKIENNIIDQHRDGIYFEFVNNIDVHNNYSTNNLRYGLHFMFSNDAEYHDNTFIKNGSGVAVMYTHNVKMFRNRFEYNWGSASYGVLLKDITNSEIHNNVFLQNTAGIFLEGGGKIKIQNNEFRRNAWAIRIMASSQGNTISRNNFLSNTFDVSTNSTSNSNKFINNYWDKYTGYDINRDGKGDVAYHPVRLFSFLVEQNPPLLILLQSFFIQLLDLAENMIPTLTPDSLNDAQPLMNPAS
jgi:nitrous oxidase accessory protein